MTSKERCVVALDVGREAAAILPLERMAVAHFVQNKILHNSKDQVAMVLFGTSDSENALGYDNVVEAVGFQVATSDRLPLFENIAQGDSGSDFLGALIVALGMIHTAKGVDPSKMTSRILLISNFSCDVEEEEDVESIQKTLSTLGVTLDIVALHLTGDMAANPVTKANQAANMAVLQRLATVRGSVSVVSDQAQLLGTVTRRRERKGKAYQVLEVAEGVTIAVQAFKKTMKDRVPFHRASPYSLPPGDEGRRTRKVEMRTRYYMLEPPPAEEEGEEEEEEEEEDKKGGEIGKEGAGDDEEEGGRTRPHGRLALDEDGQPIEVPPQRLIKAYMFGSKPVPVRKETEEAMLFRPDKGIRLLGFAKEQLPRHAYMSDTDLLIADTGTPEAPLAFSALVRGMSAAGVVAVARCVFRVRSRLRMCALLPRVASAADEVDGLLAVTLPFTEDVRNYVFPSFRAHGKEASADAGAQGQSQGVSAPTASEADRELDSRRLAVKAKYLPSATQVDAARDLVAAWDLIRPLSRRAGGGLAHAGAHMEARAEGRAASASSSRHGEGHMQRWELLSPEDTHNPVMQRVGHFLQARVRDESAAIPPISDLAARMLCIDAEGGMWAGDSEALAAVERFHAAHELAVEPTTTRKRKGPEGNSDEAAATGGTRGSAGASNQSTPAGLMYRIRHLVETSCAPTPSHAKPAVEDMIQMLRDHLKELRHACAPQPQDARSYNSLLEEVRQKLSSQASQQGAVAAGQRSEANAWWHTAFVSQGVTPINDSEEATSGQVTQNATLD